MPVGTVTSTGRWSPAVGLVERYVGPGLTPVIGEARPPGRCEFRDAEEGLWGAPRDPGLVTRTVVVVGAGANMPPVYIHRHHTVAVSSYLLGVKISSLPAL